MSTTTEKRPTPKVTSAILISEGCNTPTPTRHHFVETRATTVPNPNPDEAGQIPIWEFVFKCFKTGVDRRWGYEPRTVLTDVELAREIEAEGN